jgi:hypothetical protein
MINILILLGVIVTLLMLAPSLSYASYAVATTNTNTNTNPVHTANKFDCSPHAKGCGGLIYCSLVTTQTGSCFDEADCPNASPFCSKATTQSTTSAYASGFSHGLSDGKLGSHGNMNWYILQAGNGFAFHTSDFNKGYTAGFCKSNPTGGSDADQATFSCN